MASKDQPKIVDSGTSLEAAGEIDEKTSKAEHAEEAAELRGELEQISPRIEHLTRLLEAVKKAPLNDEEQKAREAKVEKGIADAKAMGSDEAIAQRIGAVMKEQFAGNLRASQIIDSPQGQELEHLKNRQFDLEERLKQIESDETSP